MVKIIRYKDINHIRLFIYFFYFVWLFVIELHQKIISKIGFT